MDSVNASANILNVIFYNQDSSNEAGAASCTPIEVRGEGADEGKESNQIGKGRKRSWRLGRETGQMTWQETDG